jgi:leucyl/phenylalanyl-tRNA--protein transferase
MPIFALDDDLYFPDPNIAENDGLLAIGGDLSTERLLLAYRSGIFPWFDGEVPLWWSPDPRFVLYPSEIKVSTSMKTLLRRNAFDFTINRVFEEVIGQCKTVRRDGQAGTWITEEMQQAYVQLHKQGYAVSAEAWKDGELAGGLYGIKIGKIFFGESMFSHQSNASKYAFISLVEQLKTEGFELIDCQVYTAHLESLGARMIPRKDFLQNLPLTGKISG